MSDVVGHLAELSALGRHPNGIDRALATPQERAARERFAAWARERGYKLQQDRVGNLFARRDGTRAGAKPLLVGSHLDTVANGGAYDGAYGVAGALCALASLDERKISTEHPVEAVVWAGETGSRFPFVCLGSSVFSGIIDVNRALALTDANGVSLGDALESSDAGLLDDIPLREDKSVAGYLELHIEQGPILEREGVPIGIVNAIVGQRRYSVVVHGTTGHAGTVPMAQRSDALCAAAELVLAVERAALAVRGKTVATVGQASVEPNAGNVIPEKVMLTVDIRSPDDANIDAVEAAMRDTVGDIQSRRNLRVSIERLETRVPISMDERLRDALHRVAASLGQRAIDVLSGAGHDAMCVATVAPAAMIFVPSIGGLSQVNDEQTNEADLEIGVQALTAAIVEADKIVL